MSNKWLESPDPEDLDEVCKDKENADPVDGADTFVDPLSPSVRSVGVLSKRKRKRPFVSSTSSGAGLSPEDILLRMGLSHDKYGQFLSDMPEGANLADMLDTRLGVIMLALWNMTSGKLKGIYKTIDGLREACETLTSEVNRLKGMTNFTYAFCKSAGEAGVHSLPPKSMTGQYR